MFQTCINERAKLIAVDRFTHTCLWFGLCWYVQQQGKSKQGTAFGNTRHDWNLSANPTHAQTKQTQREKKQTKKRKGVLKEKEQNPQKKTRTKNKQIMVTIHKHTMLIIQQVVRTPSCKLQIIPLRILHIIYQAQHSAEQPWPTNQPQPSGAAKLNNKHTTNQPTNQPTRQAWAQPKACANKIRK